MAKFILSILSARRSQSCLLLFIAWLCFFGLDAGFAAQAASVSQTGQIQSYAPGDDGDLKKGVVWSVSRFEDNDDGTVSDAMTGLMWMKNANCFGAQTWADALDKVAELNTGTQNCTGYANDLYADWRLPNINELEGLIDSGRSNPALPSDHPFSAVQIYYYWSSTSFADSSSLTWNVNLNDGNVNGYGQSSKFYIWPVRGGQ